MPTSQKPSSLPPNDTRPWPAPGVQMDNARVFLTECARSRARTLLLPDKDADGLCSALIVHHTLIQLGAAPASLAVHFPAKGSNIHAAASRAAIAASRARFVIATDQGSRGGPAIAPDPAVRTLVLDHHWSEGFPDGAVVCSSAACPPVATSATLAFEVCQPLLDDTRRMGQGNAAAMDVRVVQERLEWLCAIGTMGDLGTSFKWTPPFPDVRECLRRWTKKTLGEAVALVNAPRRSAEYDVETAWRALLHCTSPKDLVSPRTGGDVVRLFEAREAVAAETARCSRSPPAFSGDGRVALVRVSSGAQIHPLIATRWAGSLKGPRLEIVMCANDGYTPGMTNFSCRIAKNRRGGGGADNPEVDIIGALKEYAARVPGLREAMGDNFARGHKEASGGIVRTEQFEKLWDVMAGAEREGDEPARKKRKGTKGQPVQKNTLEGWLKAV
ncbi:DHH phosphoesterase [Epithele typhae]|uniref:DHH phosphoesterase n=1 Tax=Epithele typhae TaxID=378194 RepID=UPI002007AB5B|nr:DHH phosphoesterase [Epithele typhae]KAH9916583.1 DHH phosphoesterase [Epithele typhae]